MSVPPRARRYADALQDDAPLNGSLPPHSLEAEQGILGCILITPGESIDQCVEAMPAGAQVFYDLRHQLLYEHFLAMHAAMLPLDLITVQQHLKDANQLESIGGLPYLSSLMDSVPSSANLMYYVGIATEKFMARGMLRACGETIDALKGDNENIAELIDEAEVRVLKVRELVGTQKERTPNEMVRGVIDNLEKRAKGTDKGIRTGIVGIDRLTRGFKPKNLIVIAARPSVGKTALAMNICDYIVSNGSPVGIFSLEMPDEELIERLCSCKARVDTMNPDTWVERDWKAFTAASVTIAKWPLYINDKSGITVAEIKAISRRWKKKHGIKILFIDYLQLIGSRRGVDRREAVDEISRDLKSLARDLEIPVVVLAQLNRELDKDKNRKPRLSDLRESGQIEQDGDAIFFLYKAKEQPEDGATTNVNAYLAKQRNGPAGVDVRLVFTPKHTHFEEASRVY